jgi:hypothetical protein
MRKKLCSPCVAGAIKNEELGCTCGETRSGGGLDEMTRRKREIIGLRNEQDFPHLVDSHFRRKALAVSY